MISKKYVLKFTLILIIMFSEGIGIANAQIEWFKAGSTWHYTYREGADTPNVSYLKLTVGGDTIIENKIFSIVEKTRVKYNGDSIEEGNEYLYYDQESNSVFRYFADAICLLYNYNAIEGDTIKIPVGLNNKITDTVVQVIDSIKILTFNDTINTIKQFYHYEQYTDFYYGAFNIQYLGAENYFWPTNMLQCDAGCPSGLRCFQNGIMSYENPIGVNCEYLYNNIETTSERKGAFIYPNPTLDKVRIYTKKPLKGIIQVFDLYGKIVLVSELNGESSIIIDITSLHNGTYSFINSNYDDVTFLGRIVKIDK